MYKTRPKLGGVFDEDKLFPSVNREQDRYDHDNNDYGRSNEGYDASPPSRSRNHDRDQLNSRHITPDSNYSLRPDYDQEDESDDERSMYYGHGRRDADRTTSAEHYEDNAGYSYDDENSYYHGRQHHDRNRDEYRGRADEHVEADYSDSDGSYEHEGRTKDPRSFYDNDGYSDQFPGSSRLGSFRGRRVEESNYVDDLSLERDYDDSISDGSSQVAVAGHKLKNAMNDAAKDGGKLEQVEHVKSVETNLSPEGQRQKSSDEHLFPLVAVVNPTVHEQGETKETEKDQSNNVISLTEVDDSLKNDSYSWDKEENEPDPESKDKRKAGLILGAAALATVAVVAGNSSRENQVSLSKEEEVEEIQNLLPELAQKLKSGGTVRLRKARVGLQDRKTQLQKELTQGGEPDELANSMSGEQMELQDVNSEEVDIEAQPVSFDEFYRSKRTQLISSPTQKLSGIKKWRYERSKEWKKNQLRLREFLANFEVWRSSFKTIEGNFGTSVLSYFLFLKWLLFLNFFIMVIVLSIIVFPQQFLDPKTFNGSFEGQSNHTVERFFEQAMECSTDYDNYLTDLGQNADAADLIIDFFQGTGWMAKQVLFNGYYFNKTYVFFWGERQHYNMPLAYLLCTAAYFLVSLILMVRYTARGVREGLTHSGDKFYNYCNKVLCGWDYTLTEKKAATFKHNNLYDEYKNDLDEQSRSTKRANMTGCQKFGVYAVRFFVLLFVLAVSGGAGFLIVMSSQWSLELLDDPSVRDNSLRTLLVEFLPSFVITALNVVLPLVFQKVVLVEGYSPEFEVKITLVRTVLLRLASIAVLVITLHGQIVTCPDDQKRCGTCTDSFSFCWETYFGQQIYKLVILDFIVVVLVTLLVQFPRKLIVKRFHNYRVFQLIGLQEFEIPKNVLDLVYSQTLCWLGAFFSPLIPAITVIKFFIYFYIKKLTVLYTCTPPNRPYRASRSNSFFMIILIFSYVLCVIPIVYCVARIPPSQSCGPFRIYTEDDYKMYKVLEHTVSFWPKVVQDVFNFLVSWTFYVPAAIILCLLIYYHVAVSAGNRKMVALLKEQLALEGKDKQFLLGQVREALLRGDFKND